MHNIKSLVSSQIANIYWRRAWKTSPQTPGSYTVQIINIFYILLKTSSINYLLLKWHFFTDHKSSVQLIVLAGITHTLLCMTEIFS